MIFPLVVGIFGPLVEDGTRARSTTFWPDWTHAQSVQAQSSGVDLSVRAYVSAETSRSSALDPDRTRQILTTETPPFRDEIDLMRRFKGTCRDPVPTPVVFGRAGIVGERRAFQVLDERRRVYVTAWATLVSTSEHVLYFLADGVEVAPGAISRMLQFFEQTTLPALTAAFGPLPPDTRITIFNGAVPGVGGYFSSSDLVPSSLSTHSNERVMVYMNSDVHRPGQSGFDSVLAHEVQHFLHWVRHPQQDSWLNEGASELAMALVGQPQTATVRSYLRRSDIQATGWAERPADAVPHYGAGALLVRYLAWRIGGTSRLAEVIETPGVSTQTVDRFLASATTRSAPSGVPWPSDFDELFRDFMTALVVDNGVVAEGRYGFASTPFLPTTVVSSALLTPLPTGTSELRGELPPYGVRAIDIDPTVLLGGNLTVAFEGAGVAKLVDEDPLGESVVWWAYPADETHATLTWRFGARGSDQATPSPLDAETEGRPSVLEMDAWFDLEADYDYAGVAVSNDGGCSWRTVPGTSTTLSNPVGQNPGVAWTGASGSQSRSDAPVHATQSPTDAGRGRGGARWVRERFDLPNSGDQPLLVQVFQTTDQSYHGSGLAVANVRRDGQALDVTVNPEARGFVQTANAVRLRWAATLVLMNDEAVAIEPIAMSLGADGVVSGSITLARRERPPNRMVLVLAPLAPATRQQSPYVVRLARPT